MEKGGLPPSTCQFEEVKVIEEVENEENYEEDEKDEEANSPHRSWLARQLCGKGT